MTSKTDPRTATAAERRQRAFALRLAGLTFEQIGVELGVSRQACHGLIARELARLNTQTENDAGVLRQMEISRLDFLVRVTWVKAESGDLAAVDRLLKISERRSRLQGLDAPARTVLDVPGSKIVVYLPDNQRNPTFNKESNDAKAKT